MRRLVQALCSHRHSYLERRNVVGGKRGVPHYVCETCGRAVPVIDRSAPEARRQERLLSRLRALVSGD